MLQTFDAPVMETNCEVRPSSTVATQSLMLLNGAFILEQSAKLADRAADEAKAPTADQVELVKHIRRPEVQEWQYGYGAYDEEANRIGSFTPLTHWSGSRWQAGEELPDAKVGYVSLHATGGHPDILGRDVIRRWTAPVDGTITIVGKLSHGSSNGDGVRSRIVSSRSGKAGEWIAFNGGADTPIKELAVQQGDTIDFVTDCRTTHTSDSFNWPVTITLKAAAAKDYVAVSKDAFHGPAEKIETIPGQIVRAWQLAFCRDPSSDELTLAVNFIANQIETLQRNPAAIPKGRTASRQAMTSLCQTLLGSNEFLYIE